MGDKLKVGIIGSGMIGKSHVRQYAEIAEAEVVAIADLDEDEAGRVAEQFNIPNVFKDYHDLLKIEDIESVDVCLPNFLHSLVTIEVFEAGKHVFCEKPMARNYPEAKAMMDASKKAGKELAVQAVMIFSPNGRAAKKIIDEGGLGNIYYARISDMRRRGRPWVDGYGTQHFVSKEKAGGGALLDVAVYNFNRMFWLLGNPAPVSVSASTFQEIDVYEERKDDIDVEEMAVAFVRLENGITLNVEYAWAAHLDKAGGDVVLGSKGGIRLDPFAFYTDLFGMEADATFDLRLAEYHQNQYDPNLKGYASPVQHWVYGLLGRVPLIPTAEYALSTSLVSEMIYQSAAKGEEVRNV